MNYYLAIDKGLSVPWIYFRFIDTKTKNNPKSILNNSEKRNFFFEYFGGETIYNYLDMKKLDLWMVRNACIIYMKYHKAFCINILKRTKKDTYELVERIYFDGISYVDTEGWNWITDCDFNENNTFEF